MPSVRRWLPVGCIIALAACNEILANDVGHLGDAGVYAVPGGGDPRSAGDAGGAMATEGSACTQDHALSCAGPAQRVVLICTPTNHVWTAFQVCSGKQLCDTSGGPNQGSCQGASGGLCDPGTKQCSGIGAQTCQTDGTWGVAVACVCTGQGLCNELPGCAGLLATCGPNFSLDCCAASLVPGGTFNRSNDARYPATVSAFRLDNYEITVGRFRKFVAGYPGNLPPAGAGKDPNDPQDSGWDGSWSAQMPADGAALTSTSGVQCNATYQTWTDEAGGNESRPMNCITWYEAYAFCIWDGGRLPTEAEWNYAAAGGREQREYPWSQSSATIDDTYAVYCGGSCSSTQNVGSKSPQGDGKWGQSDLAGNVGEWVADWYATPYSNPCIDCSNSTAATFRVVRRGGFLDVASDLLSSNRFIGTPSYHDVNYGARCARTP